MRVKPSKARPLVVSVSVGISSRLFLDLLRKIPNLVLMVIYKLARWQLSLIFDKKVIVINAPLCEV